MQHIVALCGGVGGAKLADGLQQVLAPGALSVIVNTGDDFEHRGLSICPDLDTVLYTLGGVANAEQGWGRADETWQVQAEWYERGIDTWFQLGDRDIALHLVRRELQSQGMTLTEITRELARRFHVAADLLPMCDTPAPTMVSTEIGELPFQEYFVKHRCAPAVRGFRYGGGRAGPMSAAVRAALTRPDLDGIVLCPSNPFLSIAPILAVPGIRDLLAQTGVPVVAVSPLIGATAVKGPAAKIMNELDLPVSPLEVARQYRDFVDVMLIDESDRALIAAGPAGGQGADPPAARAAAAGVAGAGVPGAGHPTLEAAPILMKSPADRRNLAEVCLAVVRRGRQGARQDGSREGSS